MQKIFQINYFIKQGEKRMLDKTKNIVVTITFVILLILFFLANILKKDTQISITERRKLASFPQITIKSVLDGSFSNKFEKYTTDQIIKREEFRKLKSSIEVNLFRKKDNNKIYMYKNSLIKIEYPLNEKSVLNVANKINEIQKSYLKDMKCYYSIIPDKNYFTDSKEYITMDYKKLEEIMKKNITNAEYINIFDCLELEDYYITDIHWKQENLQKVVDKISEKMNFKNRLTNNYAKEQITEFDGIYAGQIPIKVEKDKICILTNETIKNARVYNYENRKETKIYDLEKINSNDKYDIYLSGSTPLITITNQNAKTDKELIVFRDSFASSLIPLFTEGYSKITLIDIRYIRTKDIEKYIQFKDQEVLFLYSTLILNNSSILK